MCNDFCDYKCRQTRMPVQSRNTLSKYTKSNQIKNQKKNKKKIKKSSISRKPEEAT